MAFKQIANSVGDDARLPGAGAGNDQHWSFPVFDGRALLLIQCEFLGFNSVHLCQLPFTARQCSRFLARRIESESIKRSPHTATLKGRCCSGRFSPKETRKIAPPFDNWREFQSVKRAKRKNDICFLAALTINFRCDLARPGGTVPGSES